MSLPPELEDVDIAAVTSSIRNHRPVAAALKSPEHTGVASSPSVASSAASVGAVTTAGSSEASETVSLRDLMVQSAVAASPHLKAAATSASAPIISAPPAKLGAPVLKRGFLLGGASGTASKSGSKATAAVVQPASKVAAPVLSEVQEALQDAMPPMQRLAADTQSKL